MERPEWFRTGFVALAVVGIVGVVVSDTIGLRIELTAFCGVVGLGAVVVVTHRVGCQSFLYFADTGSANTGKR